MESSVILSEILEQYSVKLILPVNEVTLFTTMTAVLESKLSEVSCKMVLKQPFWSLEQDIPLRTGYSLPLAYQQGFI